MAAQEQVLFETDSDLEHYAVVERIYEGRPARVLFSGAKRAAQSGIGLDDSPDLLFDYNQRLLELANAAYPRRVLVLGGGAFTLPMALLAALPDVQVDVVELDPALLPLSREYFGLQTNERLQITFGDGRQYVERSQVTYDLIILDVFSELAIPRPFLTYECIATLKKRLAPTGIVAMNIIASYQGVNAGLIKSQIAAYGALFHRTDIFPAAHGLTSWLPQNLVLVAQKTTSQDFTPYIRFAPIELPPVTTTDCYYD